MFKNVIVGLLAISVAGCSATVVREVRTTPNHEHNQVIEKRITFMRLVEFVKSNQNTRPTEEIKRKGFDLIAATGLRYACYAGNKCYLHKDTMKIQILPEYVYIEYPDKSYHKIYDAQDAVKIIYS